jgi:hypothetical protein
MQRIRLGNVKRQVLLLFDGQNDRGLHKWVTETLNLCDECSKGSATGIFLRELLDNALRTAKQGRFEDAAARLYRAIEMQGQIWLSQLTNNIFLNGRCRQDNNLPEELKPLPCCQRDERGEIKLSLEDHFFALDALGHKKAKALGADIKAVDASGKTKSRFRAATEKRNASILAHGVQPIGKDGFDTMKAIATELLGFDLDNESIPIPALDPVWF